MALGTELLEKLWYLTPIPGYLRSMADNTDSATQTMSSVSAWSDMLLTSNYGNYALILAGGLTTLWGGTYLTRRYLPIYPVTQWGFRAKLLFADDCGENKIFRNKSYGLSVTPDLVYRLSDSRIAYLEYKSRSYVMDSDIAQLEVGIIALRGTYNVTRGGIVLSTGEIVWIDSANKSSRQLYKKNKKQIEMVKKIRDGLWVQPERKESCGKCPYNSRCWK